MRACVLVSPYFPPSNLAGVHRMRHLAKHLPKYGWRPIVLCVDEAQYEGRLDYGLVELLPADLEIVKVQAAPKKLCRAAGIGDIGLRGFAHIRHALIDILSTRKIDAVMISGSPYYPMLLSRLIAERFRIPVVLDFQDPWVSAWGAAQSRFSKPGLSQAIAKRLEPEALRYASFVTAVSNLQNDELATRLPWVDRRRMAAVPIGADFEDFAGIAGASIESADATGYGSVRRLSYVGTIWPAVLPTLDAFLEALALLRLEDLDTYRRLRIDFIGTTANPDDTTGFRVLPRARAVEVDDILRETPQRLDYQAALTALAVSDANIVLGSTERHYTASKIYPCLMSGRPYLSLVHRDSSAHQILSAAGGGIALSFETAEQLAAAPRQIATALLRIAKAPQDFVAADRSVYEPYLASAIAGRFAAIFDAVSC